MRRTLSFAFIALLVVSALLLGTRKMLAQGNAAPSMVTRAPDDTQRFTLRGNVHPMARPANDQGAVSSTLQMGHMFLVLKRSPEQEAALQTLMAQQADKNSPNYHHWLTPAEFGAQFGASDSDINELTTWLGSHGLQVAGVSPGRNMIDFTGTAGQVREAFNTEIHNYLVNGQMHIANASDPQIPAAFAQIVAGVNRLNDFRPHPMVHNVGAFKMQLPQRKISRVTPSLTIPNGDCYTPPGSTQATNCYVIAPFDFETIYNLTSLWNGGITGVGEKIAVVSDSNVRPIDYQQFRSIVGLPAETVNPVLATGVDPGLQMCPVNSDESEAIADVEWAGAVAPSAVIDLVMAPSAPAFTCNGASNAGENDNYASGFGGDYAAFYEINLPNPDPILSDSYGLCELDLTASGNTFYNSLWKQATMEGITVVTAAGDTGSAGCDTTTAPAQFGLQVDGTASTPFDTAVGGTDFNYTTASGAAAYWSATNNSNGNNTQSVNGPIPESVYNDTCTNPLLQQALGGSTPFATCNDSNSALAVPNVLVAAGGGGGLSNCTNPSNGGGAPSNCTGGYAKPSWQNATGVPSDGARDIPDVSLFAGDGTISGTFYFACQQDADILNTPSVPNTDCSLNQSTLFFTGFGGTSISAQAFAGIVALIDQKAGHSEGNINPQLYLLANAENYGSCNNSGSTPLANSSTCVFKDITTGTNSTPCITGTTNCGNSITSSNVAPLLGPGWRFRWTPVGIFLLMCAFFTGTFLLTQNAPRRRWSAALALVIFGAMFGVVSCGGNKSYSSGSGNGVGVLSGYNAGVGYDRATGLGSVNAANLVNAPGW